MAKRDDRESMPGERDDTADSSRVDERIGGRGSDEARGLASDEDEEFEELDELDNMDEEDDDDGR